MLRKIMKIKNKFVGGLESDYKFDMNEKNVDLLNIIDDLVLIKNLSLKLLLMLVIEINVFEVSVKWWENNEMEILVWILVLEDML